MVLLVHEDIAESAGQAAMLLDTTDAFTRSVLWCEAASLTRAGLASSPNHHALLHVPACAIRDSSWVQASPLLVPKAPVLRKGADEAAYLKAVGYREASAGPKVLHCDASGMLVALPVRMQAWHMWLACAHSMSKLELHLSAHSLLAAHSMQSIDAPCPPESADITSRPLWVCSA